MANARFVHSLILTARGGCRPGKVGNCRSKPIHAYRIHVTTDATPRPLRADLVELGVEWKLYGTLGMTTARRLRAMIFTEIPACTEDVETLLSDDDYAKLQAHLAPHPDAGDRIRETGGLRKVRWTAQGRGKRGGTRIIYYHLVSEAQIRMLLIYRKGIKDDLSARQKALLRKLNEDWE